MTRWSLFLQTLSLLHHSLGLYWRKHRLSQLSGPQRQYVAIARAMVHEPAVILIDDPARDLNSTSREELMGLIQKLNDEGRTIVVSAADSALASYCQSAVRISEGATVDEGPVSKRRIIQASRIPGSSARAGVRDVVVCPRCNYGNFKGQELCTRCEFSLDLTREEEQSIERQAEWDGQPMGRGG